MERCAVAAPVLEPSALDFLEVDHLFELRSAHALVEYDGPARVAERDHLRALLHREFRGVQRDIARARDRDPLAFDRIIRVLEHRLGEGDGAVPGCLGPPEQPAEPHGFAREHAIALLGDLHVLPVEEPDLASADADVARGDIHARADVSVELAHERLAEAHDLVVALALGVEVAPALAAADGLTGERVLEALFVGEEVQRVLGHARVEPQTALVGPEYIRVLDAPPEVHLNAAGVVDPLDTEADHAVGDQQPIEHPGFLILPVLRDHRRDRFGDLLDRGAVEFPGVHAVDGRRKIKNIRNSRHGALLVDRSPGS